MEASSVRTHLPSGEGARRTRLRLPLPAARWARWTLAALLVFTFARGVVWSVTVPAFWAPDEDYHFLYVEYLTIEHSLPSPDKPLYPREYPAVAQAVDYDAYGQGARTSFHGDPHASVGRLGRLPQSARRGVLTGRGVGVVHPPLYHLLGAAVNASLGHASVLTRLQAVRWLSTVLGVLAVYLAWLLAAQVLRPPAAQLFCAALVATQPMIAFLSGIVNHDIALICAFTGALAAMAWMLRSPPSSRQGIWLGVAVAAALLVKSTALALLPLALLVYVAQALIWRGDRRQALRSAAWAAGIVLVLAGWWYIRAQFVYYSATGATVNPVASGPTAHGIGIGTYLSYIRQWTMFTYRTYWWHFLWWEAPRGSWVFWVPAVSGAVGIAGLLGFLALRWRRLLDPQDARARQAVLFVLAVFAVWLPLMGTDVVSHAHGGGFQLSGGRYLLPVYPAVAVLFCLGVRQLAPRPLRAPALWGFAVVSLWFLWNTWKNHYVHRYYGHASWGELLRRLSFDRPEFITAVTIGVLLGVAVIALVIAAGAVAGGASGPPRRLRLPRRATQPALRASR